MCGVLFCFEAISCASINTLKGKNESNSQQKGIIMIDVCTKKCLNLKFTTFLFLKVISA